MALVVSSRLPSGPGRLQVFVGDFGVAAARKLSFTLDGVAAAPVVLRPLSSVRGPAHGVPENSPTARCFTGVFEFRGLPEQRRVRVGVSLGNEARTIDVATLPSRVPPANQGGFDVLLASCFHQAESSAGAIAAAVRNLKSAIRAKASGLRAPDCSLFMGDQVYLDLPTLRDFPDDPRFLASKFEADYRLNWQTGLEPLLGLAPWACVPDDHEYWNNAPHPSTQNGNTWSAAGRKNWGDAAALCYSAFAKPFNDRNTDSIDDPLIVDVHPISIFIADGRSRRDPGLAYTLTPACRDKLRLWIDRLNQEGKVGLFVSGQSLLQTAASQIGGKLADWELPNYRDYGPLLAELGRAKNRLLLLTGDVHWGRVSSAYDVVTGAERLQEVIVSPLSLVTTVGADQWKWLKGLFRPSEPWPRHGLGGAPPSRLQFGAPSTYRCTVGQSTDVKPAQVKGDQLGLLSFDWTNARLRATVRYFPVHDTLSRTVTVPLFDVSVV
jgi:hypothetical protein